MYAHADCGMLVKEETFYEQKMSGLQIGIREWQILCRDFLITPCMGTVKENSNHYHSANVKFIDRGRQIGHGRFDEFCCAFRHIAREAPCLQEIPLRNCRENHSVDVFYEKTSCGNCRQKRTWNFEEPT